MHTRLAVLALATAALAACEPNPSVTGPAAALQAARDADVSAALSNPGAVYTLTNQVGGNAVAVFARGADGRLTAAGPVSTGGTGSPRRTPINSTCTPWTRTAWRADPPPLPPLAARRSGSPSVTATSCSCRKPQDRPLPTSWTRPVVFRW